MATGEPRIDLEALKNRLRNGVERAVNTAQASTAVSSASEPKSQRSDKPRAGSNGSKSELNPGELVRLRKSASEYISEMEVKIARAQTVEELMELADRVSSKKGPKKEKFSLKLPNGLPALLPVDRDFSGKFNTLINQWEKRIVEVLFDDAHKEQFRVFLRDVQEEMPQSRGIWFCHEYLDRYGLSILWEVPAVRVELAGLWGEYYPLLSRGPKDQKKREKEFAVGEEYVLRDDPSKEYVITGISDDKITYKSADGSGLPVSSTKEKFSKFLKKKSGRTAKEPNTSTITFAGKPGKQEPIPTGAGSNSDISSEPSMRSYDELMGKLGEKKRDIALEMKRLESAVAAGLQEIVKVISDEDEVNAYIRDDRTQLVADFSAQIMIRLEKLPWTPEEKKFFAETFVEKSIEDFLK